MRRTSWVILLLSLFVSVPMFAQKFTGTLTGTVTDPSGAVVAGASVKATSKTTGATRTATTNTDGSFSFPELNPDSYDVSVSKEGFKEVVQQNVALHVADTLALHVQLSVGATTEKIEVQVSPSDVTLQTQSGEVSNTILGEQVRELPLNGRNFVQLTTLVPGASVGANFDNKNKGLFSGVDISFSGSPSVDNQWTVDGASNNDIGSQRTILVYPSIDGIDEFKIQRNSYGPEYGGASGAQINVVTKGGGNQFHGDAYYFGRNDVLNAKNWFLGVNGPCVAGDASCRKQLLRFNSPGYTIGGPIKKDKLFFFWSQEWNNQRLGRVHAHFVPTVQERTTGDFSDLVAARLAAGVNPSTGVYGPDPNCAGLPAPRDPSTGNPFPGDNIANSSTGLSPGGMAYLATLPAPTTNNLCVANNWVTQVNIPVNWREENIRGDLNLTKNTSLTMRYTQDKWVNFLHADEAAGLWGDSDFPALSDTWNQPGKSTVAKLTTTLGNTAVNDFQFSWSGNRIGITRAGDQPSLNDAINSAIPRLFPFSGKMHGTQAPEPVMWNGGAPSGVLGIISPWNNRQDLFVWKDDFSKVSGSHTFKVGFLYSRNAKDEEVGDEGGEFWGQGSQGSPAATYPQPWGGNGGTGNYYADYLLKGEWFGYDENQRDAIAHVRWRDYEFYGGDTWKATRRLTLNYGARWAIIRPTFLEDNKLAGFSQAVYAAETSAPGADSCRGMILAKGAKNDCPAIGSVVTPPYFENRSLVHYNNHLIAPRLGFAWDVFGSQRFVFRGGAGQFTPRDRLLSISMRANNPPFGVNTGALITLDCANPNQNDPACESGAALGGVPHQGVDPSSNQANSWQWNLTTETALWKDSKLELAWVANRGIHLMSAIDANQVLPANQLAAAQSSVTGGGISHPYPFNPGGAPQITIWNHKGDNIYHSLQAMFTTKLHHHSMLQAAYTWSKNLGNTTFGYVGASTIFGENDNPRLNRGPVDFDRRHVFSANFIYNLPEFKDSNVFTRGAAGGWETSTIVNYASGNALTITGFNGLGDATGTGSSGTFTGRPLRVSGEPCHLSGSRLQWLNPAAFTWNGYQLGTQGNSGPGQCAGPPINNVDFAIDKNWGIPFFGSEKAKLQFRMSFYNLFNHPQFTTVGFNSSYTVSSTATDPNGTFPVDASGNNCSATPTSCVAIAGGALPNGSKFGQPTQVNQSGFREMEYGLKLIF